MTNNDFTAKGQQTRQHLIATAIRLFTTQGYEATTMRDIADAAECSPGLTYRYFAHKEELVIALYEQLAEETLVYAQTLPLGTMADRYYALMLHKMAQVKLHRAALAAMFGAVMRPDVEVSVWGNRPTEGRDHMLEAFTLVVKEATDKPQEPLAGSLGMLFYCVHLLLLLFWLYDRTPETQATTSLLNFMQEAIKLVRPMLLMPLIAKAVMKLATILAQVFGANNTPMLSKDSTKPMEG